ncbi:phosphatidate cytidylyltransferase [Calocera viscosa TUFC12733]|uniref:Phosphatidate cytidylyltransferase n=1 Tax=Calocera viscosa (strain TUFC12733) TaxID=1330018 RepID=A0A167LC74_CALVF|nr:phosphatidate cytidylyltransferase [Calocera viscosa TUFC12733]
MREVVPPPGSERAKKFRSIIVRTMTTLIMLALFFLIMAGGTPFVVMLVLVCQALVYREVTALFELTAQSGGRPIEGKGAEKSEDRWSKTLNWYFFAVTNYFLYGESLIHYFKHVVFADAWLTPFATNHRFISFMLYMIGFVGFVSNLKRQYLRQQFGLFCWVHMTLFLIVVSSHFIVNNILEGLIWFWVPACLVICNDIFAYVWGMSFGRTPLIQLSPKKTVEGFVGAFFTTLVFAYILGTFSMRFNYMICPGHDLGVTAWDNVECEKNPVFIWRDLPIGEPLVTILSTWARRPVTSIPVAPFQFHSVVLACFASLVAPFGGFFASGFKRAFDIKDFGDSIPGHGGMTDRMDCQFLMGMFTYVYYSTLIRVNHVTPGSILQIIVSSLGPQEQLELYRELTSYLHGRGLLGSS